MTFIQKRYHHLAHRSVDHIFSSIFRNYQHQSFLQRTLFSSSSPRSDGGWSWWKFTFGSNPINYGECGDTWKDGQQWKGATLWSGVDAGIMINFTLLTNLSFSVDIKLTRNESIPLVNDTALGFHFFKRFKETDQKISFCSRTFNRSITNYFNSSFNFSFTYYHTCWIFFICRILLLEFFLVVTDLIFSHN